MDIETLVDNILTDRITIADLDIQQMEAVIDFMREHISTIPDEDISDALLELVDVIQDAAEVRFANQASGNWDQTIEDSIARGNSYFELENYVIQ
jgi:hypothetical protein